MNWTTGPGYYPSAEGGDDDWWHLYKDGSFVATLNCPPDLALKIAKALEKMEREERDKRIK